MNQTADTSKLCGCKFNRNVTRLAYVVEMSSNTVWPPVTRLFRNLSLFRLNEVIPLIRIIFNQIYTTKLTRKSIINHLTPLTLFFFFLNIINQFFINIINLIDNDRQKHFLRIWIQIDLYPLPSPQKNFLNLYGQGRRNFVSL